MTKTKTIRKNDPLTAALKASRRGSREAEIELHGKPLPKGKVHRSKKAYDRKRSKAGLRDLPLDFTLFLCSFL